jgi:hypothetical protein
MYKEYMTERNVARQRKNYSGVERKSKLQNSSQHLWPNMQLFSP